MDSASAGGKAAERCIVVHPSSIDAIFATFQMGGEIKATLETTVARHRDGPDRYDSALPLMASAV